MIHPTTPEMPITDPGFVYYNAASTDVQRTWRRFGWKPLAERQQEAKA